MRAAICTAYGPPEVLRIEEVPRPVPEHGQILVKVHASTVNSSDWFVRSGLASGPMLMRLMLRLAVGFGRPRRGILGLVLAGEVAALGAGVRRFKVGDRVYAFTMLRFGGYAQYACLPETAIVALAPSVLNFEQAAAVPYGGLLALYFLRRRGVQPGQRVLVYGASGAVGTSAVQLARHLGASVTAVCGAGNIDLVTSLGAEATLDYARDLTPGGARYDLVFDAVGKRKTSPLKEACAKALTGRGRNVSVDDGTPKLNVRDLEELTTLAERGILRPVIDRSYPLEQIVEAHRYAEQEHKKGSVTIIVRHDD